MAFIEYPTNLEVQGPWLIDAKSLEELDSLMDSCVAKMQELRDREIDAAVTKEMAAYPKISADEARERVAERYDPWRGDIRRVTAYLTGGRNVAGATFKELILMPTVHNEIVRGFAVKTRIAETEIDVKLGVWGDSSLTVNVSSRDGDLAQELFGLLQNWVTDIQPKKWRQKWLRFQSIPQMLLIFWVFGCLLTLFFTLLPDAGPSQMKQQARDLAKQGVNSSNQAQAIQLLLSIESGYEPHTSPLVHHYPSYRVWIYLCLVLLILIGLSKPPKGAIGIWDGKRALERQRNWLRIVSVTIPTLVLSAFVVPWISNLMGWPH